LPCSQGRACRRVIDFGRYVCYQTSVSCTPMSLVRPTCLVTSMCLVPPTFLVRLCLLYASVSCSLTPMSLVPCIGHGNFYIMFRKLSLCIGSFRKLSLCIGSFRKFSGKSVFLGVLRPCSANAGSPIDFWTTFPQLDLPISERTYLQILLRS